MTPPGPSRRKASRRRQAWDIGKYATASGILLALTHQSVDLRGKLQLQQEHELATAGSVAAMVGDVARIAANDKKQDVRLSRLERPPALHSVVAPKVPALADTVSRSPGPFERLGEVVAAPVKLVWGGLKALFGGG